MTGSPRRRRKHLAEWLLGAAAVVSAAAVLGILLFLAWFCLPLLRGGADVWSWEWAPFRGRYGILTMVVGSLLLSLGALAVAFPVGIAISAFAHGLGPRVLGRFVLGVVYVMTGIPTIVYAFVSAMLLVPFVREGFAEGSGYSLLTAVPVLGALILPTVVLLVHAHWRGMGQELDVTTAAIGLSRTQALLYVILPLSKRGLLLAGILGFARAVGDTMIALVLSGNAAQVPSSPLDSVRALTAHVALFHSTDSQDPGYASIFAAGLILLLLTGILGLLARSLQASGRRKGRHAPVA